MNKEKKTINFKESLPLHKYNDWDRRQFIRNVGLFLGAFGIPSVIQTETMEKISKKVFGSATAWAQSGSAPPSIIIGLRAGYNYRWVVGWQDEAQGMPLVNNMNTPFAPQDCTTINTSSGNNLVLTPASAPFLSAHADNIALTDCSINKHGHSSEFHVIGERGPGANFAVSAAAQSNAQLKNPLIFGNSNRVSFKNNGGYGAAYGASKFKSVQQFIDGFSQFTLNGMNDTQTTSVLSILTTRFATMIESLLKESPSQSAVAAANDTTGQQLLTSLGAQLAAVNTDNFGGNISKPRVFREEVNWGEVIGVGIQAMSLGLTNSLCIADNTQDWHNRIADPNRSPGNGTPQRDSAEYIAQILGALMTQAKSGNFMLNGQPISESLRVVMVSEFGRTPKDSKGGDNGDGGGNNVLFMGPTSVINAGSFAKLDENNTNRRGRTMGIGSNGQFVSRQNSPDQLAATVGRFLGLDLMGAGFSKLASESTIPGVLKA